MTNDEKIEQFQQRFTSIYGISENRTPFGKRVVEKINNFVKGIDEKCSACGTWLKGYWTCKQCGLLNK